MITLESFTVRKRRRLTEKSFYEARAEFSSADMNFSINLPLTLGEVVVQVCRGAIIENSKKSLQALTILAEQHKGSEADSE